MEFNDEELELIRLALKSYQLALRINCIYCESVNKDTDNFFEQHCETYKRKKEVEKLIKELDKTLDCE